MTVLKIEWQINRKNVIMWSLSLAVILILFMSIFPSMKNSGMKELLTTKLDTLPENMLKAFHLNSGPSLVETTGYFAYVFQYLFIAACIYAIMLGSKSLIKEETGGTIEFLYAQPISRLRIVMEKVLAAISMLLSFWLVTYLVSLATTLFFNQGAMKNQEIIKSISKVFVTQFFVLIFFLSLGFLLSSFLKQNNSGLSMGIVFILYLFGIVGDLEDKFSFLKNISPLAQASPSSILVEDTKFLLMGLLSISSIFLIGITIVFYQRKDLKI